MRLGAHLSVAGGFPKAFQRARATGCETMQVFTRAPTAWKAREISDEEARAFRAEGERGDVTPVIAHAPYLLNLASPDEKLLGRSVATLTEELERCHLLGIRTLVMHPGAHVGTGVEAGLSSVAEGLRRAHGEAQNGVEIALEITAGAGTVLGGSFEELAGILDRLEGRIEIGICLDTAHLQGAGYDLASDEGYAATMDELDRLLGIELVRAVHANDTPHALGSRKDRHCHIGEGELGTGAFLRLLGDPRLAGLPLILETPKDDRKGTTGGDLLDRRNLRGLRKLRREAAGSSPAATRQADPTG